jgi:hypothetical protein
MDPCVFYKIIENEEGRVMSYIVVITWVDDCRFFGTPDLVKEYEETILLAQGDIPRLLNQELKERQATQAEC